MKKTRHSEEQIIGVLKQMEAGRKVPELARELGVSEATLYTWKSKYGARGQRGEAAARFGSGERQAQAPLADAMLDNAALKDLLEKNGDARCWPQGGGSSARRVRDERAAGVPCGRGGSVERAFSASAAR